MHPGERAAGPSQAFDGAGKHAPQLEDTALRHASPSSSFFPEASGASGPTAAPHGSQSRVTGPQLEGYG